MYQTKQLWQPNNSTHTFSCIVVYCKLNSDRRVGISLDSTLTKGKLPGAHQLADNSTLERTGCPGYRTELRCTRASFWRVRVNAKSLSLQRILFSFFLPPVSALNFVWINPDGKRVTQHTRWNSFSVVNKQKPHSKQLLCYYSTRANISSTFQ